MATFGGGTSKANSKWFLFPTHTQTDTQAHHNTQEPWSTPWHIHPVIHTHSLTLTHTITHENTL